MSLFLCVDCGGSKTSVVIAGLSGELLGRALGGPSNFAYLGLENFLQIVRVAVDDALKDCISSFSGDSVSLPPSAPLFAAAWFGISGVDSPAAIDKITPPLSALLNIPVGPRLLVCNDTHLLAAPLRMHNDVDVAVTCIAGTGSIVVSFKEGENGVLKEMGRVGGWGWILGDEGGGYSVGREAIRTILQDSDLASVQGPPDPPVDAEGTLTRAILNLFEISDVFELLTVVHLPDPPPGASDADLKVPAYALIPREKRLSQLAPLVFRYAFEEGDPLALRVLRTTSSILVDQICILLRPDAPQGVNASNGVICFGGSLAGIDKYRQMMLDDLKSRGYTFKRIEFVDDAAAVGAGGLALAFKPE